MMLIPLCTSRNVVPRRTALGMISLVTVSALSACALPGSGDPPRRVSLSPATEFPPNLPAAGWSLRVQEPSAPASLNTAKIAFRAQGGDLEYLSTGVWTERAPDMVMTLLVRSFENTGVILSIGDRRTRIRPDFDLNSELRDFQIVEVGKDKARIQVRLHSRLIRHPRRDLIGETEFDAGVEVSPVSLDSAVAAFDEALSVVMADTVEWALKTGRGA